MKKILLYSIVALQAIFWSAGASAAACVASDLATYTALGATGCTIGGITFSDFALLPSETNAIPSTSITVTPIFLGGTIVEIDFGVSPTSSGGNFYDDPISYRVAGGTSNFVGATVDFTGSSTTGDAAVSVDSDICLGGGFDAMLNCSSGNSVNLAVVNIFDSADPAYSLPFSAVGSLAVLTDIAYDSGSGFAGPSESTLTSAINQFNVTPAVVTSVPEPAAGLLLAVGLLGLAATRRRNGRSQRFSKP